MDYSNKLVIKPWGSETEVYRNDNVSVWHLNINKFNSTSLHCHPNKKTVLVVLSGGIEFSFLNEKKNLLCGDRVTIRHGVFHSSRALTDNVQLLEIENPPNKEDLVRLKDNYGREFKPYESGKSILSNDKPRTIDCYWREFGDCSIKLHDNKDLSQIKNNDVLLIKDGTVSKNGFVIAGPGDPCTISSLAKFEENGFIVDVTFIVISRND